MLTIPHAAQRELARLLQTGAFAWVVALEARPGQAFYITANPEDIHYAGRTWQSFPMQLGEQNANGEGDLSDTTLTVSNIGRLPMAHLESGLWDQGDAVVMLVFVPDPDGVPTGLELRYQIQGASATRSDVTFNLSQPQYFGKQFPGGLYIRDEGFPGIVPNPQ